MIFSVSIANAAITSNSTPTSSQTTGATSLTWSHTVAAGTNRILIVELAIDGLGAPVTDVTYGGVAMTQVGRGPGNHAVEIWRLVNPAVGTANVVANFTGTTAAAGGATTFNGVDQSTPTGTFVSATGTGTTASVTAASAAGNLVIDAQYWKNTTANIVGTGQASQWSASNATMLGGSTSEAGAAAVTMTGTCGASSQWEIGAVSINADPGTTTVMMGQWKFDANANDYSGNGYNGTLTNGALIDNTVATNKIGSGKLSLDGVNDLVTLSPHVNNFAPLTAGTISAWIKTAASQAVIFSISHTADAGSSASLYLFLGKLEFTVNENSAVQLDLSSTVTLNNNAWHHVAFTVNASGNKLYIDGVQAAVTYTTGNAATQKFFSNVTTTNYLAIGAGQNNSGQYYPYAGLVDDVRVYNGALTAADINNLFNQGSSTYTISGNVFEDVNYGGGAGRTLAASSGVVRSASRVELFDGTGAFVTSTTTDGSGNYSFASLAAGNYTVRTVSSSVTSSRTGYVAGLLSVQTYRTNASTGTAVDVIDYVGGQDPATADAGNAAAGWILNSTTGSFSGSGSGKAHAFAPVTIGAANVTGVNFGFNFDTIVNINDSGQGCLRQFLTNANTLGGDVSLAQSGQVAAKENAVFMVSNGTAAVGLRAANNYFSGGVATISSISALPNISTPIVIDAQKQPGWTLNPVVALNGASAGASVSGLVFIAGSGGSSTRGLIIQNFTAAGINITASSGNTIAGNWIGLNATGTAAAGNNLGINIWQSSNTVIGGATAADRNVISGNTGAPGINISDPASTGNQILGNYIGTNAGGTAAVGNKWQGIYFDSPNNIIGGTAAGYGNVISGTISGQGVLLTANASGTVIQSNYIGLNAAGTAALGNNGEGISISSANNTIGGSTATARNIISGNSGAGVYLHGTGATGNSIKGNYIGTDAAGTAALGNGIVNVVEGVGADGASNNTIGGTTAGEGNRIWYNGTAGVAIQNFAGNATGNAILGNSISGNATSLGIDLSPWGVTTNNGTKNASLPNSGMDFPVFTSAYLNGTTLTVSGYVGSAASQAVFANARVEIFKSDNDSSGYGEGQTYLGFLTANASGNFSGSLDVSGKGVAGGDIITGTATDGSNNTSEFGANYTVLPIADLALTLTDNPDPAAVGGEILYTMIVTNNGPETAPNVTVTNTLPAGVTFMSATPSQGSCSGTATVTCSLGAIPSTGTASIEIIVVTSAAGTVNDSASVTGNVSDLVPGNNSASVSTTVVAGTIQRTPLSQYARFHGFIDYTATGGSLRTGSNTGNPCAVVTGSSANLTIPAGATVVGAYLYWAGSGSTIDNQVSLDGTALTADRTFTARYVLSPNNYDFFGGFKDVTAAVQAKGSGTYSFGGLTVDTSSLYCSSQSVMAGWALVVVYSNNSLNGKTLLIYDGFDIRRNDSVTYTLTGIYASGSPPQAKTSYLVWEGDSDLSGNGEGFSFNNNTISDGLNPADNVFNNTINSLGINTAYGMDLDTYDVSSYVQPRQTQASIKLSVGTDLVILNAVLLEVQSNIITGHVFEDVNYGGGAGRDLATAVASAPTFTVPRPGATVELYSFTGAYLRNTTTDADGEYGFAGLVDGLYTVRVLNGSVTSSRQGAVGTLVPVQTFRSVSLAGGPAIAVTNEVGGARPKDVDAPANTTNANLNTLLAQSKAPALVITGIAVTGADFGYNFDTVVNVNDSGQGSLRQFITNANALNNTGLAQTGRTAGIDNAVWMISNGTAAPGLQATNNYFSGGLATISPISAMPAITDHVMLDGTTQPGWTTGQIIKLSGSGAGGGSNGLTVSGGSSLIKGLIIDSFGTAGISLSGAGGTTASDNIIHANNRGIYDNAAGDQFFRNVIYSNSGEGIYLDSGATSAKIYHNTIHGNTTRGISQAGGSATVRNNLITGNGGVGLYSSGGTLTESYNGITDAVTTPANSGGRSNVALSSTDLNINPLYVNAASGNFSLTECTSPAINNGIDLGADQPDMNGAVAGLWNNNAPDMGAFESGTSCAPNLAIVKQAWNLNGSAPLTTLTAPVGSTIAFLIYVKNTTSGPVTDLRINDSLDETAFQYLAGSMLRTSAATPPSDTATDLAIFTATASGTGTPLTDGVDGDVASAINTGGLADIDRITIGAVTGQANASLALGAHSIFGLRFNVKIK